MESRNFMHVTVPVAFRNRSRFVSRRNPLFVILHVEDEPRKSSYQKGQILGETTGYGKDLNIRIDRNK